MKHLTNRLSFWFCVLLILLSYVSLKDFIGFGERNKNTTALLLVIILGLLWFHKIDADGKSRDALQSNSREARFIIRLLKLFLPSDEEQEYIIGDLLEEYGQFQSRTKAYFWLCKQVMNSALPLVIKVIRHSIASRLGKEINRHS